MGTGQLQVYTIGQLAKKIREKAGDNQRAASRRLGISPVDLCRLEKNVRPPSKNILKAFEAIYGVELDMLAWAYRNTGSIMQEAAFEIIRVYGDKPRK